jgi:RNA polymerase sigma-70 factor (ECF subfamily)
MQDADLVGEVLGGNTEAYADLVLRWTGRVTALCHARIGRADIADELAQETLVRGFEELPSLADPARFGSWLAGIAANTCRDWWKSRQNSQVPFSALTGCGPELPGGPNPLAEAERADDAARLMRAVEELPEEYRVVLMFFYYQQASYRDIAQLLDVSTATVNARLTKARSLLRSSLGVKPPTKPESGSQAAPAPTPERPVP